MSQNQLLPVLRPSDWHQRHLAAHRTLLSQPFAQDVLVTVAQDLGTQLATLTADHAPTPEVFTGLEQQAVANLAMLGMTWKVAETETGTGRPLAINCVGEYASEMLLSRAFMQQAHSLLGSTLLAVTMPMRGMLYARSGTDTAAMGTLIKATRGHFEKQVENGLSPYAYIVTGGVASGVVQVVAQGQTPHDAGAGLLTTPKPGSPSGQPVQATSHGPGLWPKITSARTVRELSLGAYNGRLLDEIQAAGEVEYTYALSVTSAGNPILCMTLELNATAAVFGGPSHFLCAFYQNEHTNLGGLTLDSITAFETRALKEAAKLLGAGAPAATPPPARAPAPPPPPGYGPPAPPPPEPIAPPAPAAAVAPPVATPPPRPPVPDYDKWGTLRFGKLESPGGELEFSAYVSMGSRVPATEVVGMTQLVAAGRLKDGTPFSSVRVVCFDLMAAAGVAQSIAETGARVYYRDPMSGRMNPVG